ncbi:MAG: NADH-quinone oxidoreductase subunit C [Planctomycetota bacterium]|nr:NADH-quinone oxidoreductase subunit C [Planctomycetota bacterium]
MSTLERVVEALAGISHTVQKPRDGAVAIEIEASVVPQALAALRDRAGFDTNVFVTAIDRYPAEPRFTVCYSFLSTAHNDRVRVQARIPGEKPHIATITHLWPGTAYSERECYDMFGIVFDGHTGLKRLLMPQGYDHHPLRKDFPHQGIEPDRLYREWDQRRRDRSPLRSESEA